MKGAEGIEREEFRDKQNVAAPFAHYLARYLESDAAEIAARTGLAFDETTGCFTLSLVGTRYCVTHPDFLVFEAETRDESSDGALLKNPYEEILLLRYLLEGRWVPDGGRRLAYEEMPWGPLYLTQFKGRVIGRLLREFGRDQDSFRRAVESVPGLRHEKPPQRCDAGFRLEFLSGLWLSVLFWAGDEEFPPSAQLLFDDNFRHAFTAEDMAVVGDVLIGRLKRWK